MKIIADTSVLLNFALLGKEDLLVQLMPEIVTTPTVRSEFIRLASSPKRFYGLKFPVVIPVHSPSHVSAFLRNNPSLDEGEVEVIALALEWGSKFILMDEMAGRRAARNLGLVPVGTLGILLDAKSRGRLAEIKPLVKILVGEGKFRLSQNVIQEILRQAGE